MRASFSLIPMPESRSRTMVYAFQGAPRHSWESSQCHFGPDGRLCGVIRLLRYLSQIGTPLFSSTFLLFSLLHDFSM